MVRRSGRVLAAMVSSALLVGTGYAAYNYNALTTGQQTIVVDGLGGPRPSTAATATTQHVDGSAENILIVGDDSRAGLTTAQEATLQVGSDSDTTSTDTLLLVHVPGNGKQATMVSIPRDSYVAIPGFNKNKINAAYIDGYDYTPGATTPAQKQRAGVDELVATIKALTGVTITQYLRPSPKHHPVSRWVKPQEFVELSEEAEEIGFAGVLSGPLVRSSYRAGRLYQQAVAARV